MSEAKRLVAKQDAARAIGMLEKHCTRHYDAKALELLADILLQRCVAQRVL